MVGFHLQRECVLLSKYQKCFKLLIVAKREKLYKFSNILPCRAIKKLDITYSLFITNNHTIILRNAVEFVIIFDHVMDRLFA